MNHGGEALIGLACAHGDALEFLEFLEEIFNEMAPSVFFGVVGDGDNAVGLCWNDRFDAAFRQKIPEPIGIIGLVAEEGVETQTFDQGGHAGGFAPLSRQQLEADQLSQPIDQRQDLGGQATPAFTDRLILGPPFAPWPWR